MKPYFLTLVLLLVLAQFLLPKRLAFIPLVIAGCHLGNIEILPELTPVRLLIILGIIRAIFSHFIIWPSARSRLDIVFILFTLFALLSSFWHKADLWVPSPFNARAGLVLNTFGTYLYGRAYLSNIAVFRQYTLIVPIVLIPLALFMTLEHNTGRNYYSILGAISETSMRREGKIRANGPFRHPILAGTAGATALPFAYLLWSLRQRKFALISMVSCMGVVIASASSGPLAAVAIAGAAIFFHRWRKGLQYSLWAALILAFLYSIIKERGPWFIMAHMDLVGGSTGWHRAMLIDRAFEHMDEWWLWGTDYTRHWLATGVQWNPNMVDLTNYYIHLGVIGGLPLTLCLIGFIVVGFRLLSQRMAEMRKVGDPDEIVLWCAGASLATHAVSFVSISYFDQMYVFFYLLLGAIPGLVGTASASSRSTAPVDKTSRGAFPPVPASPHAAPLLAAGAS